jgi:hypothetical protein
MCVYKGKRVRMYINVCSCTTLKKQFLDGQMLSARYVKD